MDYHDIREAIRSALATIPAIQAGSPLAGKVYWEWTAPADTVKPWLEMAFDGELPSLTAGHCALHMQLEVLVFGEAGGYHTIDPIADAVVTLLHHQNITTATGKIICPEYIRDSRFDAYVDQLKASVIRLKFLIPLPFKP